MARLSGIVGNRLRARDVGKQIGRKLPAFEDRCQIRLVLPGITAWLIQDLKVVSVFAFETRPSRG